MNRAIVCSDSAEGWIGQNKKNGASEYKRKLERTGFPLPFQYFHFIVGYF